MGTVLVVGVLLTGLFVYVMLRGPRRLPPSEPEALSETAERKRSPGHGPSPRPLAAENAGAVIAEIRKRARRSELPFTSSMRGAVCIQRLLYGLPEGLVPSEIEDARRALAVIRLTICHDHHHEHYFDQFGAGRWFEFRRHVTAEGRTWTFTVSVLASTDGSIAVDDVKAKRPDDDHDADGEDADGAIAASATGSRSAGRLPYGLVACPCCRHATLSSRAAYQICPVCFWEDDGQDSADADEARGGPNTISLTQGRKNFLRITASVEADVGHVRKPFLEEARLRHFDAEGREVAPGGDADER